MRQPVEPPQEEQLRSLPMPNDQSKRNPPRERRVNRTDNIIPPTMGRKAMRVTVQESKGTDQKPSGNEQSNFKPPSMRETRS